MLVKAYRLYKQESPILIHCRQTLHVVTWHIHRHVLPGLFQVLIDFVELILEVAEAFTLDLTQQCLCSFLVVNFS